MHPRNDRDLFAGIDGDQQQRRKMQSEIDLAVRQHLGLADALVGHHIADSGKTFRPQQILGDVLRLNAKTLILRKPDRSRFWWPLIGNRIRSAEESRGTSR